MKTKLALVAVFFAGFVLGAAVMSRLAGGLSLDRVPREILFYQAGPDCVWPEPHANDEVRIYHDAADRDCTHGNDYVWFPTDAPCLRMVYADKTTTQTRRILE